MNVKPARHGDWRALFRRPRPPGHAHPRRSERGRSGDGAGRDKAGRREKEVGGPADRFTPWRSFFSLRMTMEEDKTNTCGTICLKYLLLTFNLLFWLAGGAVMAVGIWTLVDKSDYISLLASSTYSAAAYILILAGAVVIVTGAIGCCATIKEQRGFLIVYFVLLLLIFLLEITAGVLAYIYHQELSDELRADLKETMVQQYQQPGQDHVTRAVDRLQQDMKCCGSSNSSDWDDGAWIHALAGGRRVPDSCCKTPSERCGRRDHPSNIYKVEGGCIRKLEEFVLHHLLVLGCVAIGIAFLQLMGMVFTCCLYHSLKEDPY
ncbi:CD151 antigen-like isoform X2 [Denticeps clupeoides]|nr:CD151 antigen-like isoform X2 [Denticeps clupeoides]XP_028823332.1 CD151 antigen-like isoform X2 [Denticeps clupeoides]